MVPPKFEAGRLNHNPIPARVILNCYKCGLRKCCSEFYLSDHLVNQVVLYQPINCHISTDSKLISCLFLDIGEACWWTVHPASKQRSEGEKVRVGDDLILVSVATERYLVSYIIVDL
jgi:hypothetical protein